MSTPAGGDFSPVPFSPVPGFPVRGQYGCPGSTSHLSDQAMDFQRHLSVMAI